MAYASLTGTVVSLATAQQVLRNIIASQEKRVTIDLIQKRVSEHFNLREQDLKVGVVFQPRVGVGIHVLGAQDALLASGCLVHIHNVVNGKGLCCGLDKQQFASVAGVARAVD